MQTTYVILKTAESKLLILYLEDFVILKDYRMKIKAS